MGPVVVIPTEKVQVPGGGEFAVRGMSLNDALQLYYRHAGQLSDLFDQFAGKVKAKEAVAEGEVLQAGVQMIGATPLLMAEIIALSMDADPTDVEGFTACVQNLLRLSLGVQMDALQKIGALTFTSDMPPGKFLSLVLATAQSATASLSAPKT